MDQIRATGAKFVAISTDDPEKLRAYAEQEGFDFPFLVDEGGQTIEDWGLLNTQGSSGRPIPHPALVTIDREGFVVDVFVETDFRVRPDAEDVVRGLQENLDEESWEG